MVNSSDFTKRLEKIIEYYGLSATAFSEEIEFNRSTISHLLSGRNKPSLEFVMKVVQTFPEVELYWLLNGKGSFPNSEKQETKNSPAQSIPKKPESDISNKITEATQQAHEKTESSNSKKIERIVVFYTDGSFKSYSN
ncbi:helix-turn-helix transcriptional regulator [Marixanthomonas sp. SCSIO 43207]|uniref:helix-turn-helix domain-containing protein n=1 Tax=Marixanthomonas sp. SCSIO 43207 TaxID=2779360 RepID=UPI001CA82421|nr:helix-turn-helix transcriptional regulator [Marixanthomonas sp. SCSIO 43207]UAB80730.1 helix-turn-helix transcriptional regulator [Marixanthomonas sp. SCSIO 43207]